MEFVVDKMTPEDWTYVADIFAEGISTGVSTFETSVPSWETWDNEHCKPCRLVARSEGKVIGWAAISQFSNK